MSAYAPLIFALAASVSFGLDKIAARKGLVKADAFSGMMFPIIVAIPLFFSASLFTGEWFRLVQLGAISIAHLSLAGMIHFIVGRLFAYSGVRLIGANRAAPIMATSTMFSVIFGVVLLQERITPSIALGAVLIVLGVVIISLSNESPPESGLKREDFAKGIVVSVCGALFWGISPLFVRIGVSASGTPILGVLISNIFAAILYVGISAPTERYRYVFSLDKQTILYLIMWSVLVNLAQLFRYVALAGASVSIVEPLTSSYPMFTLLFSAVLIRRLESFSLKVVLGSLAVIIGIFLVLLPDR